MLRFCDAIPIFPDLAQCAQPDRIIRIIRFETGQPPLTERADSATEEYESVLLALPAESAFRFFHRRHLARYFMPGFEER